MDGKCPLSQGSGLGADMAQSRRVRRAQSVRLLFASTVPVTLDMFMRGQLAWLASQGHDLHVVSSPGPSLDSLAAREGVAVHPLKMEREISPARDVRALLQWVKLIRHLRPDVVVVSTPKAGLLGGFASAVCRVPRRVYMLRGARFEGVSGARGVLLRAVERVTCASSHRVIAVSQSLAQVALDAHVVGSRKLVLVGQGSSNGVDLERFHPPTVEERAAARSAWGLRTGVVALVFVGRLHADKGLRVLHESLAVLTKSVTKPVVLLLAGSDEGADLEPPEGDQVEIRKLGHVEDIPGLLHAADVLVLPTQREGFPNVVLEAAASSLPVVTTDATGAVDSVVDGVTGFTLAKTDGEAFGNALLRLVESPGLRSQLGAAARRRVEADFASESVWDGMRREYLGNLPHANPARVP